VDIVVVVVVVVVIVVVVVVFVVVVIVVVVVEVEDGGQNWITSLSYQLKQLCSFDLQTEYNFSCKYSLYSQYVRLSLVKVSPLISILPLRLLLKNKN